MNLIPLNKRITSQEVKGLYIDRELQELQELYRINLSFGRRNRISIFGPREVEFSSTWFNSNLNRHINYNGVKNTVARKILNSDRNFECPIVLETISYNAEYMQCYWCEYNFIEYAIRKHLNNNNTCPICRENGIKIKLYFQINML
jgi:hypothetical protein